MEKTYNPQTRSMTVEVNRCFVTVSYESHMPESCIWHYVLSKLAQEEKEAVMFPESTVQ